MLHEANRSACWYKESESLETVLSLLMDEIMKQIDPFDMIPADRIAIKVTQHEISWTQSLKHDFAFSLPVNILALK